MSKTPLVEYIAEYTGSAGRSGHKLTLSRVFRFYVDDCGPEQIVISTAWANVPEPGTVHPIVGLSKNNWDCELYAGDASFAMISGEEDRATWEVDVSYSADNPNEADIALSKKKIATSQEYRDANPKDDDAKIAVLKNELELADIKDSLADSAVESELETRRAERAAQDEEDAEDALESDFFRLGGGKNVKTWSTSKYVTVPFLKAYQDGDKKGFPTLDVIHPYTGEKIIAETTEKHVIEHFSYEVREFDSAIGVGLEGTTNKAGLWVLNKHFPAGFAVIDEISAEQKIEVSDTGTEKIKYQVHVAIERLPQSALDYKLAYRGYLCRDLERNAFGYAQIQEGEYGIFNSEDHSLDVTTPQWINGETGEILQQGEAVTDDYYGTFPQIFAENWSVINLPERKGI